MEVDAVRELIAKTAGALAAQERPRWGWRRLLIMIRRGGAEVREFRFRHIYRSLALQVRPRKKRKVGTCAATSFQR